MGNTFELKIRDTSIHNARQVIVKVNENDCWECISHVPNKKGGYPRVYINGKHKYVHRLSYQHYKGEIPKRKPFILHSCDNTLCCNPDHLRAGTTKDNFNDMIERNRRTHVLNNKGSLNGKAKLSEQQVIKIRELYATGNYLNREIAKQFNVSKNTISRITARTIWRHI